MKIIRGLHNIQTSDYGCVATIGNFDGVHIGHQQIIKRLLKKSLEYNLPALVMIFEPHPKEFFAKAQNLKKLPAVNLDNEQPLQGYRLCKLRDKIELLQQQQVDGVLVVNFNQQFADLHADDFVEQILLKQLGIKYLLVGDDFCYGKKREGDYLHLQQNAKQFNFRVEATKTYLYEQQRVSSTRVRQALIDGDMDKVYDLSNHPYFISGHVQHGAKKGRSIGFPTANICLKHQPPVISGVFAVQITIKNQQQVYYGVANIGYRPTVKDKLDKEAILEVHLFEFSGDLYGQLIKVAFLDRIRDEKKFASFDELKLQIGQDVTIAKNFFNMSKTNE